MKSLKKTVSVILLSVCFVSNIYPAFAADTEEYFTEAVDAEEYSADTTDTEEYFDAAVGISEDYSSEILGQNLVLNGSFEAGTDNWTNWEGNYASASETYFKGSKSMKIWANKTGDNEQLLQNIKVKPGSTYKFSTWMRIPSGQTAKCSLLLEASGYSQKTLSSMSMSYNSDYRDYNFTPNKVDGSAGDGHTVWREMSTTIVVPEAKNFPKYNENDISTYPNICIYIQYTSGGNWNRYLYIDDVTLYQIYSKKDVVKDVRFYQNNVEITDSGFTAGTVVAEFDIENVTIHNHTPYAVIVAYNGNKMLNYNSSSFGVTKNDGTFTVRVEIEITNKMIQAGGCSISAFMWSDLGEMESLSETYGIGAI